MQTVSRGYLDALKGSVTPVYQVDAWYDGELVLKGVPVESGSVTLDRSRAIQGSAKLLAADPDDVLIPSGWGSPLAPYGSELHIRAGHRTGGGETEMLSLGWYRIDDSDPNESWSPYYSRTTPGQLVRFVPRGARVSVDASDRMATIEDARFLAPEAPESPASVVAEIKRLARFLVPISDLSAVGDASIPGSIAYQTSRAQAIQALAGVLDMTACMNPNGALTLRPDSPVGDPVWTIEVGLDGQIVDWGRKASRQGLYNAVISSGTTPEGVPVQGVATEDDGPLRWDGPFGRVPYAHSSPLITSGDAATADAETLLARLIRERVVPVTVRCPAHHGLLPDDIVRLVLPDATLTGPISSLTWEIPSAEMTFVARIPRSQLWR